MSAPADWGLIFRTEGPRLVRFLRRFAPAVSAQDIAQDSFERAFAAPPEAIASPRAYLFRTARNLAIDAARRQAIAPVRAADPSRLEPVTTDPSPEDQRILADNRAALARALLGLPEHKRLALVLLKAEGWSYNEIGRRLGVSPRTVERYVADAIAHCYKELRDPFRD